MTLFSHLQHPGVTGGHGAVHTYLSGVKMNNASAMPEGNISIDQKAAEYIGADTRFSSMQFTVGSNAMNRLSWTRNGVAIPPQNNPYTIFNKLFRQEAAADRQALKKHYNESDSILDAVRLHAAQLQKKVSRDDRLKLDEYFTSIRELEKKLDMRKQWVDRPKAKAELKMPYKALKYSDKITLMYDLMLVAMQTDSSRVFTLGISEYPGGKDGSGLAVSKGYHDLTHHGKSPQYLKELTAIETFHVAQFSRFLGKIKNLKEADGSSFLDNTNLLFGSGMGNASSHRNDNLPLILAGGGFKHGEHKNYGGKGYQMPACNLYLSILQQMGFECDSFGTSSGTLKGLATL